MRVALVTDRLANGGAERQLALLARGLNEKHDVLVLSLAGGVFAEAIEADGVAIRVFGRRSRWDAGSLLSMMRACARWEPDVIHAWGWTSCLAARPLATKMHVPLVYGLRSATANGQIAKGVRPSCMVADLVLSNSHAGAEAFRVPSGKLRVLYNGMDDAWIHLGRLAAAQRSDAPPIVVAMVARMVAEKDHPLFIRAAAGLARTYGDAVRFCLVGHGPRENLVRELAQGLIASGSLEVVDAGADVTPVLRRCHVGVLLNPPNSGEGCSNAIMEYMAFGMPVVCSRTGGNPELVTDQVTGFVVEPGDEDALQERLGVLIGDEDTRGRMARACLCAATAFSRENMVARTLDAYRASGARDSSERRSEGLM